MQAMSLQDPKIVSEVVVGSESWHSVSRSPAGVRVLATVVFARRWRSCVISYLMQTLVEATRGTTGTCE